jgi:circadian clock protein KaiC
VRLETLSTGIQTLDQIVGGGLLKGGVYIVQGAAGTGKTILANQIAFNHVAAGGRVAYVTLLAESHARMIQHMELFSFYVENAIPRGMHYISAFNELMQDGLPGVVEVLSIEMRQRKASLIVLDGLVTAAAASQSPQELKLFIGQIQAISTLADCSSLLLNSLGSVNGGGPEQTMVDGILVLRQKLVGSRHERSLEVAKFRGAKVLYGAHTFRIGDDGIVLCPQLETIPVADLVLGTTIQRVSAVAPGLDEMLGGGYPMGSVTAISGPEGTGKTLLGLQFLSGASEGEPALLFGLDDSGEMAERIGAAFGIDIGGLRARGILHVAGQPRFGESLDEVGYRLLAAVRDSGARRVFIDGLASVVSMPAYEERGAAFFAALFRELRRLGATTLFSVRVTSEGAALPPGREVSPLADNSLTLAVQALRNTTVRSILIAKVQASTHDLTSRTLELTSSGIHVGSSLAGPD